MFEVTVNEFPFVKELPKSERISVRDALGLIKQYVQLTKEHGTLIPLFMVPRILNVSRQRVHQFVQEGRLASHNFDGFVFVPEDALLEFAKTVRKTGRHISSEK